MLENGDITKAVKAVKSLYDDGWYILAARQVSLEVSRFGTEMTGQKASGILDYFSDLGTMSLEREQPSRRYSLKKTFWNGNEESVIKRIEKKIRRKNIATYKNVL
jgi:hypothetical protein